MASKRTTDTATTRNVGRKTDHEAEANTDEQTATGADTGNAATGDDAVTGPQTTDPELAGARGEFDGALARREQDVQTEGQANARVAGFVGNGDNEVQEFIETKPGSVQSTKPVNEPA